MAKRKRKMTLFDVINTGQPIGLQVRQRVPTYQPTPELPVKKKLAKLFGRKPSTPDAPLTAAEELERLRRELAGGAATTGNIHEAARETIDEPAASIASSHDRPLNPPSTRNRVAEYAAALSDQERAEELVVAPPKPRGKPLGQVLGERWAELKPKLSAAASRARSGLGKGGEVAHEQLLRLRDINSRYAVTAAAALGVIVLLGGSFYAGKLLFNRPAVELTVATDLADGTVRSDVLELGAQARANEPIANVVDGPTQTRLERKADAIAPTAPNPSAVFSGRRQDLNYVIIQSYRSQVDANAVVDVLAKYGIKATVERNLPRWPAGGKDLFSVVSLDGFARMGGNDVYQNFLASIAKISERETGSTLPSRLDPRPYKYQAATP